METALVAKAGFPTIVSDFSYSPLGPTIWRSDPRTGLEYRDVGLDSASHGLLLGRHWRNLAASSAPVSIDGANPFAFLFVLKGRVTIARDGKEDLEFEPYGSVTRYGSGEQLNINLSPDAELLEIRAGEGASEALGTTGMSGSELVISRDSEDAYVVGAGPRKFFKYRDLGTSEATGRRIHMQVVAVAKDAPGGTGWHRHSMGQIFYVLTGSADLALERQPWVNMAAGDAMCICPGLGHNVPAMTSDYSVLEMCVPADYDTNDMDG